MGTEGSRARSWTGNPRAARFLRVVLQLIPLAIVTAAAWKIHLALGPASGQLELIARWVMISIGSTAALTILNRVVRHLLPVAALLQLTLAFPDEAPSRFKTALRASSARQLRRDLEAGTLDGATPQEAAEILVALIARLSAHDRLTRGHTERVRAYTDILAEELDLDADSRQKLHWGAPLHDVGKLDVPADILNKPGRPDRDEWAVIQGHPEAGWRMLTPLHDWLGEWGRAALEHHERWDGTGYPSRLAGEEISTAGRAVAIADAYDVMTSTRSYKRPMPLDEARAELARSAGSHFDPKMVKAFLAISLGRLRVVAGPLSWLAQLPALAQVPIAQLPAGVAGGAAAAGLTAASMVAAPALGLQADPVPDQAAVERAVAEVIAEQEADELEPLVTVPALESGTDVDGPAPAPSTTTTTTTPVETDDSIVLDASPIATTTTTQAPGTTTTQAPGTTITTTAPPVAGAPPTTTTTTTAPPTTTAEPTSTTAPPDTIGSSVTTFSSAELATAGGTTSMPFLPLGGTLQPGPLPNYDTDQDDDPGLRIRRGDGIVETQGHTIQRWRLDSGGGLSIDGSPRLDLWVATQNFDVTDAGDIEAGLYDCDAGGTGCALLASGTASFDQASFGADFGPVAITMGSVDHQIAPGRALVVKVATLESSDAHLWYAYGTTTYPAELTVS